jgi:thiol:disulfide interchange protein DsbD
MKALFYLLTGILPLAAPATESGASVDLISELSHIAPGRAFEVGIRIRHRPGFHSYWKNPGVVGFATQVDWSLPPGFKAGPLAWPAPEHVDMAGHPAHGYHRDVLLTASLTPPADLESTTVTLRAEVAWMACAKSCHPGRQTLELTLPVGPKPRPDRLNRPLFKETRAERPPSLKGWTCRLLGKADADPITLELTRNAADAPTLVDPYFFSADGQIAVGEPLTASREKDRLILTFKRSEHGPGSGTELPGLLEFGPQNKRRQASIHPRRSPR